VTRAPVILLLAGEESGDKHGARVAGALRRRLPRATLVGLGGSRMEAQGVQLLAGLEDLAVMGFAEVLRRLPFFWRLERRIRDRMDAGPVDLVLAIDYPGFNLRAARAARERGIPVLYYIAPQVWAWRARRAARLARDADHVAVILPFEAEIFRAAGADVTFVGHPLLDDVVEPSDRNAFIRGLGLDPDRPVLALFPGSRKQELERHLPVMQDAARRLRRERPWLQVAAARAPSVSPRRFRDAGLPHTEEGRALLRHARAAVVKSGTSTLEAALEGTPFVTVYRTHPFTFFLARHLVRVERIALANLVAGEDAVPELIQGEANPERIAAEVGPLLDADSDRRDRMVRTLGRIGDALGRPGAAERVAEIAGRLLRDGPGAEEKDAPSRAPGARA